MLVQYEERAVSTVGVSETQEFSIKANAKAFKVLIDGLYSDKIRAVIRELWTNAFDSHTDAGCPETPFMCTLPDMFNPEFIVRDFGVSLSHDDVMNLYTTVFESTKEDTNDQVGKLGLGSKSPFAYTDSFTVTAWMDGEQRVYSAYLGSDHIPRISLLDRSESAEPTGLSISFPVELKDIDQFAQKAGIVARGFDTQPTIVAKADEGARFTRSREMEIVAEGTGWKMFTTPNTYGSGQALAKQGCVLYPILADSIKDCPEEVRIILESNIILDFPMGSVDIAASREGLSYDADTQANIIKTVEAISVELTKSVLARFNNCRTLWEATERYQEMMNDASLSSTITRLAGKKLSFRGNKLDDRIVFKRRHRERYASSIMAVTKRQARNGLTYRAKKHWDGKWSSSELASVTPKEHVFYVQFTGPKENPRGIGAKIAYHLRVECEIGGIDNPTAVWIKCRRGSSDLSRFLVIAGRPPADRIFMAEDLDEPPKSVTQRARTSVKCKRFSETDYGGHWHDEVDVDVEDSSILYIETLRGVPVKGRHMWGSDTYKRALKFLKSQGKVSDDAVLVQVPGTHRKKIARAGDVWTDFVDIMAKTVKEVLTPELKSITYMLQEFDNSDKIGPLAAGFARDNIIPATGDDLQRACIVYKGLSRLMARSKLDTEDLETYGNLLHIPTRLTAAEIVDIDMPFNEEQLSALEHRTIEHYPMIQHIFNHRWLKKLDEKQAKDAAEYISLVAKC